MFDCLRDSMNENESDKKFDCSQLQVIQVTSTKEGGGALKQNCVELNITHFVAGGKIASHQPADPK